ncbi:MAG: mechanosensitive ion channel family protein [Steroidobacteraceae bacterium]
MQSLLAKILNGLDQLTTGMGLVQLAALALIIIVVVALGRWLRKSEAMRRVADQAGFRYRLLEALYIVVPHLLALVLTAASAGFLHALKQTPALLDTSMPLIGLLVVVRLAVFVFRVSAGERAPIKGWGNTISLLIWTALSLHMLGWFEPVVNALDSAAIQAGSARISIWSVVKVLFTVGLFVLGAVWLARWIERRLMAMTAIAINMRIGLSKFFQAGLIALSILLGLNASGLDLTTLNVLTGAIGIGLGFGLQAIASNFVSGFVLLMDRSIKPGDVISFSGTTGTTTENFGWVHELRGRYVVVRDRDGVDTLVPNQHLITNPVINWSYTDPRVRLKLPVRVSYDCDPEEALAVLIQAAHDHHRILRDPCPVSRLMGFGDYGFDLELRFWIADPQEGVNNVRSDVNRTIWKLFQQHGIRIPVPQYDVKVQPASLLPDAAD